MNDRVILHSDMNCFYASVEMMLHPELRGKAVAVCGATESRHGIVLAKSELAKRAGIKTGMVNWEAQRLCPGLILIPPHFEQYIKYSKLARDLYLRYTDFVEPYGLDECFLDVSGSTDVYGSGRAIAEDIRKTVKDELGLTVSIGVSFNKVFAKLGSDMKKPDAITEITRENFRDKVWCLPVSDLLYVGRATAAKLARFGVHTIGELAALPPEFLQRQLGVNGLTLHTYANGLDTSRVMDKDFVAPVKSVGHGITCVADLLTEEEVWLVMLELSQDIGHKLREYGLWATGVQITVKDNALEHRQYQAPLHYSSQNPMDIAKLARRIFSDNYDWHLPVRAVTVRAINLIPCRSPEQLNLFDDPVKLERSEKLFDCVEDLRRRFGKHSVGPASLIGYIKMPAYRDHELTLPGLLKG